MILLIDNYDSFTFNLVQLFRAIGCTVNVVRNDAIDTAGIHASGASHVVISPGPCSPREAGVSIDAIRTARVPLLGVCLGHQAIAMAFGGRVVRGREAVHGKPSEISHDGQGLFADVPSRFRAARYHSLVVEPESLPRELEVTARTDDGTIMALSHRERPIVGVQFHPESVISEAGARIARNFVGRSAKTP